MAEQQQDLDPGRVTPEQFAQLVAGASDEEIATTVQDRKSVV